MRPVALACPATIAAVDEHGDCWDLVPPPPACVPDLRFIETRFDLPALTRRDANAKPLLDYFDFAHPPFRKPPSLSKAPINVQRAKDCPGELAGS